MRLPAASKRRLKTASLCAFPFRGARGNGFQAAVFVFRASPTAKNAKRIGYIRYSVRSELPRPQPQPRNRKGDGRFSSTRE